MARKSRGSRPVDRNSTDKFDQTAAKFTCQPTRSLLFSIIFTALVMWQSGLSLWWALPIWFIVWAFFILGHSFYNWANLKLIELGRRNKKIMDEQEKNRKPRR